MKFLVIGDPHGTDKIFKMPVDNADAVIIPGDFGNADLLRDLYFNNYDFNAGKWKKHVTKKDILDAYMQAHDSSIKILEFLAERKPTFVIFGSVEREDDVTKERNKRHGFSIPLLEKEILRINNMHLLNNRQEEFNGVKIAGNMFFTDVLWAKSFTPDSVANLRDAEKSEARARKFFKTLEHVDILITHQPPYGYLDLVKNKEAPKTWNGKHAGSPIILDYINKHQPKYHICGHIHEGKGTVKIGKTTVINAGHDGDHQFIEIKI